MATPTVQVNVRVPVALHKELQAQAKASGGTVSSVVMLAVRELIARTATGRTQK